MCNWITEYIMLQGVEEECYLSTTSWLNNQHKTERPHRRNATVTSCVHKNEQPSSSLLPEVLVTMQQISNMNKVGLPAHSVITMWASPHLHSPVVVIFEKASESYQTGLLPLMNFGPTTF